MNRVLFAAFALGLGLLSQVAGNDGTSMQGKGTLCWPLHFAGITVGVATDSQVQRLLGPGVLRPGEGRAGGRYFIDTKKTSTLHITEGTGGVVEDLILRSGVDPALRPSEYDAAMSKWFEPDEGFGTWHALQLDYSPEVVLKNLGEPHNKINSNEWVYESTCVCELPAFLKIRFKNGRLWQLELSEEE
jgi:hypothetical protein